MNQTTRSRNISATSEDNNNYTPLLGQTPA